MKRFYITFLISISMVSLHAQNIGISNDNTFTTPQSPLHIYWTSDGNLLQLSRSNAGNTGLTFSVSNNDYSILNRQNNALIFGTNATERMRIFSSGAVRIGYGSGATDALQVGGFGTTNPTVFIGAEGSAPGYGRIGLYGTSYGTFSTILRGGGLSYFNSGNQYVFGHTTAVDASDFVGIVGNATYPWALSAYTEQANAGAVYGQSSGNNGFGVYGSTNNNTGIGVYGINNSITANINAHGVYGYTTNSSGTGVFGYLNNTTPDINAAGVYGVTNNPRGDGGSFSNSSATGNNIGNGIYATTSQSSGAGLFAMNSHSNGIAIIGLGGNYSFYYPLSGGAGVEGVNNTATGVGSYFRNDVANTTSSSAIAVYGYSNATVTSYPQTAIFADCGADNTNNRLGIYCRGRFTATGTKSSLFKASDGTTRLLYCTESPEVWYEDIGVGQLNNGIATIYLDTLFLEAVTINEKYPMHVFIQLEGKCSGGVYVEKEFDKFRVIQNGGNDSNAPFSYRVIAKRKGNEDERFGILLPIKEAEVSIEKAKIKSKKEEIIPKQVFKTISK